MRTRANLGLLLGAALLTVGCTAAEGPSDSDETGTAVDVELAGDVDGHPGDELGLAAAVLVEQRDIDMLWDELDVDGAAPRSDDHVVIAVVGGESSTCPYDPPTEVTVDDGVLTVDLGDDYEVCTSDWNPRTLLFTADADTFPVADDVDVKIRYMHDADAAPTDDLTDQLGGATTKDLTSDAATLDADGDALASLTDVAVSAGGGGTDVTFTFAGGQPGVTVELVEGPFREDPSGQPLEVDAAAAVMVSFHPAAGRDEHMRPTYDGPRRIPTPDGGPVTEIVQQRDHHGGLGWLLATPRDVVHGVERDGDQVVVTVARDG